MKIESSSIAMASSHHESSYTHVETMTIEGSKASDLPGAILSLSSKAEGKDSKSYMQSMEEYKKQQEEKASELAKKQRENLAALMSGNKKKSDGVNFEVSDEYKQKLEMLKRMLEMLKKGKLNGDNIKQLGKDKVLDLRSQRYQRNEIKAGFSVESEMSASASASISIGTSLSTGTTWQRVTAVSGVHSESEDMTFATQGMVQTADGRSIGFNMEISMSRAFTQSIDKLEIVNYIKTDPLMINLDTDVGSVTDQKFKFDLDSDGKEEDISFAGKGSGFLALDKNGDGKINDGSELFGTKSGDGFKDLAAYDEDGNGWIDENDSIFDKLKVWTKDEDGNDRLMDLKQADVGAIYLGNADTQFSLKDEENKLNAEIKKTGIYLHEGSGKVGTLNHVDLAV